MLTGHEIVSVYRLCVVQILGPIGLHYNFFGLAQTVLERNRYGIFLALARHSKGDIQVTAITLKRVAGAVVATEASNPFQGLGLDIILDRSFL